VGILALTPKPEPRIKPFDLAFSNGHGRYIAVTIHPKGRKCPLNARWVISVTPCNRYEYKFRTISLPKNLRAVWITALSLSETTK
jgi:hypothetical protein